MCCTDQWRHTRKLPLADSNPFSSEPIELVIGANLYGQILRKGTRKGTIHQPIVQKTIFGWILSEYFASSKRAAVAFSCHTTVLKDLDLDLCRFWEIEDLPPTV